jgi:type IV pilus assembly protein PilQ
MKKLALYPLFWLGCWLSTNGQNARLDGLSQQLDVLIANGIPLQQSITITFDGPVKELVSFLAESTKLNLTVVPGVEAQQASVTFTDAAAKDVILYLCDAYRLDLNFTGNIIAFSQYQPPPLPSVVPRELSIALEAATGLLSLNLRNDTLEAVSRKIALLTGKNIVLDPSVRLLQVSGFMTGVELESCLKQIAANNSLQLKREPDFFKLEPNKSKDVQPNTSQNFAQSNSGSLQIQRIGNDLLNIQAFDANALDIIREAAAQLGISYFLLPDTRAAGGNPQNQFQNQGNAIQSVADAVTFQTQQVSFRELLNQVFKNTNFGYVEENGLYIIGQRLAETMRDYHIYQFQNRSVQGALTLIPDDLMEDMTLDTFPEQNSVILSGSQFGIARVKEFFAEIDKLVPVILIEVMLVDVQTNRLKDFGLEAGIKAGGTTPGGPIVDPSGVNFSFSPQAINDLLTLLSGRSIINLGQVSPNFYLTLKAVQENGVIDLKSTPKLSTLNSHKAMLSIGQKRYFQEQQVSYPGADRPIPIQANVYREVEANLDIEITPIVSGDEQVTLNINFEQTEFTGDSGPNAPPPQVSRKFESMIRVRNGEMVVLGGLESSAVSKNRRGVPFLSRIPGLGWLFGRSRQSAQKGKLLIFVKPTIVN